MDAFKFDEFITGEFIYLRKVEVDDTQFIYSLRTSKCAEFLNQPPNYSLDSQKKWILSRTDAEINYIIHDKATNERVGMVAIVEVNWKDLVSSVGRLLLAEKFVHNKTPYGIEALQLTYGYVFNVMNFRKITGVILKANHKVVRLQSYLGMKEEGLLKKHVLLRGNTEDEYVFSLFKEEFEGYSNKIDKLLKKFR